MFRGSSGRSREGPVEPARVCGCLASRSLVCVGSIFVIGFSMGLLALSFQQLEARQILIEEHAYGKKITADFESTALAKDCDMSLIRLVSPFQYTVTWRSKRKGVDEGRIIQNSVSCPWQQDNVNLRILIGVLFICRTGRRQVGGMVERSKTFGTQLHLAWNVRKGWENNLPRIVRLSYVFERFRMSSPHRFRTCSRPHEANTTRRGPDLAPLGFQRF